MKTSELNNSFFEKLMNIKKTLLILLFSLASLPAYSAGGVGLNATRIVYQQGELSTSVGARNNTDINYLAKFMISGDDGKNSTLFSISPPLIKINSKDRQDVKIYFTGNGLPTDRESLFYFSATMIPGTNGPLNSSALNIGYKTIIKLFYRPSKLTMTPEEAYQQLAISVSPTGIVAKNNSPYYISMNLLTVNGVNAELSLKKQNTMISPYGSLNYVMPENGRKGKATWKVVNDLGGENVYLGNVK